VALHSITFRPEQTPKAHSSIYSRLAGRLTVSRRGQAPKAASPTVLTPSQRFTEVKFPQYANVPCSIFFTLPGTVIEVNPDSTKAKLPMDVTLLGKVMDCKL
jgi:hypothetical protein